MHVNERMSYEWSEYMHPHLTFIIHPLFFIHQKKIAPKTAAVGKRAFYSDLRALSMCEATFSEGAIRGQKILKFCLPLT
jgi:hypothetical protein